MKQSPKLPAEKRRSQLIKAAEKVFSKKGYRGSTTDEIARAAGLTKGALYFHFKGKREIFCEVIKSIFESNIESIIKHINDSDNVDIILENMINSGLELIIKKKYIKPDFWRQAHAIPEGRKYICESNKQLMNTLIEFLMKRTDLTREDCDSYLTIVTSIFDGLVAREFFIQNSLNIEKLADDLVAFSKYYIRKNQIGLD